jgi:hypothetical protein
MLSSHHAEVKRRTVIISPEARALLDLYDWIADAASPAIALGYIERIQAYLNPDSPDRQPIRVRSWTE